MSGRSLLHTAHRRHVVTKATYATLARQLTLAYLQEIIFVNRNAVYLSDTVIIHIVRMSLSKPATAMIV